MAPPFLSKIFLLSFLSGLHQNSNQYVYEFFFRIFTARFKMLQMTYLYSYFPLEDKYN